jgi:hypothetical protein
MKRPIVKGIGVLGLLWGIGGTESDAQVVDGAGAYPNAPGTAAQPYQTPRFQYLPGAPGTRRTASLQPPPPTPSPTPPVPEDMASPEGGPAPANESDIALPKAERAEGGGEPTQAAEAELVAEEEKAEEEPTIDESKLLMNAFGRADAPVKVYGWIQNSYTYNADGRGNGNYNFGVNPNFLADRWMGNQYYLVIENPLEMNDRINFGFRVDNLFGNDWQFNHMRGLNEHSFRLNHFLGYDPAQIYAEVHLPFLTKGGIDVK